MPSIKLERTMLQNMTKSWLIPKIFVIRLTRKGNTLHMLWKIRKKNSVQPWMGKELKKIAGDQIIISYEQLFHYFFLVIISRHPVPELEKMQWLEEHEMADTDGGEKDWGRNNYWRTWFYLILLFEFGHGTQISRMTKECPKT